MLNLFRAIEISKKKFDRITKMLAYCLGHRVDTADISLTSKRPPETNISKKIFLTEKRKCSHIVQGTAFAPLTPFFHLYNLQKSTYRKKIWDRKTNVFTYCLGHRVSTADTSLSLVQPPEIVISTETFWNQKTNILAYCLGHRVGTADTSLSPLQSTEIDISTENFWY